jgi:hypothetical protein
MANCGEKASAYSLVYVQMQQQGAADAEHL